MFNWIKEKLKIKKNTEEIKPIPLLFTIHGFGVRRSKEMDEVVNWANEYGIECQTFDLFDINDESDCNWKLWHQRAEEKLKKAVEENREIYLLGFSMGGVIAADLASRYPIKKLILISPAFIHFHIENYTSIAIKSASSLIKGKNEDEKKPSMPKSFYQGFMDCIKALKNNIANVNCPVLIIQGDDDEIIPVKSSVWAFNQILHKQKRLIFLHGGKHRILSDPNVNTEALALLQCMIEDKIVK